MRPSLDYLDNHDVRIKSAFFDNVWPIHQYSRRNLGYPHQLRKYDINSVHAACADRVHNRLEIVFDRNYREDDPCEIYRPGHPSVYASPVPSEYTIFFHLNVRLFFRLTGVRSGVRLTYREIKDSDLHICHTHVNYVFSTCVFLGLSNRRIWNLILETWTISGRHITFQSLHWRNIYHILLSKIQDYNQGSTASYWQGWAKMEGCDKLETYAF